MDKNILRQVIAAGEKIFFSPNDLYGYREIFLGISVNGKTEQIINENQFLAFGYHNLNSREAMSICIDYFLNIKPELLKKLEYIYTLNDLINLEEHLYIEVYNLLNNSNIQKLDSYNRIRKTINLFIKYIISKSKEINQETRSRIVPFLFVPLDNYIFKCEYIFTKSELSQWKLKRTSTLGEINTEKNYYEIQNCLNKKASYLSTLSDKIFYRIYFDILKNNRIACRFQQ